MLKTIETGACMEMIALIESENFKNTGNGKWAIVISCEDDYTIDSIAMIVDGNSTFLRELSSEKQEFTFPDLCNLKLDEPYFSVVLDTIKKEVGDHAESTIEYRAITRMRMQGYLTDNHLRELRKHYRKLDFLSKMKDVSVLRVAPLQKLDFK